MFFHISTANIEDNTFTGNSVNGSAMYVLLSNVTSHGTLRIQNNVARFGDILQIASLGPF